MLQTNFSDSSRSVICSPGNLEVIRWSGSTVERNLEIDEILAREAGKTGRRILRFWWGTSVTAVLGCGDKPERALFLHECERRGIGWVKRVTGGGTVIQTPGVFNYSYTAPDNGQWDMRRVFEQGADLVIRALSQLGVSAQQRGTSDIAVDGLKISGNAQARKWKAVLLHGTLLVDIDRELMEKVLRYPTKEPSYRNGRAHSDFVVTLADLGVLVSEAQVENAFSSVAVDAFELPNNG